MKAVVVFSSIFFLLGLKLSSIIDFRSKAEVVDTLITNKIMQSKPVKSLPLFKDSENEAKETEETEKQEIADRSGTEEVE
jgi:hypothetical protein